MSYTINWPDNPQDDAHIIHDDRLWIWDGQKWVLQGSAAFVPVKGATGSPGKQGPPGPKGNDGRVGPPGKEGLQGPTGIGITVKGSVNSINQLPNPNEGELGDAYTLIEGDAPHDLMLLTQDPNGVREWVNIGAVEGPQGSPGEPGRDGNDGDDGAPGEVSIAEEFTAPIAGPRGKLYIDNLNNIYVTTGRK